MGITIGEEKGTGITTGVETGTGITTGAGAEMGGCNGLGAGTATGGCKGLATGDGAGKGTGGAIGVEGTGTGAVGMMKGIGALDGAKVKDASVQKSKLDTSNSSESKQPGTSSPSLL